MFHLVVEQDEMLRLTIVVIATARPSSPPRRTIAVIAAALAVCRKAITASGLPIKEMPRQGIRRADERKRRPRGELKDRRPRGELT
jgi:hypothetical protein